MTTILDPGGPLVGRSRELEVLRDSLADDGIAVVAGPPGIGKTRLLGEVGAAVSSRPVVLHLAFREIPRSPWAALTDCLSAIADEPAVRSACAGGVPAELAQLCPALAPFGSAPNTGSTAGASTTRIVSAVTDLLDAAAGGHSAAITADDVQWAPPEMVELLRAAMERVPAAVVLAIREPHHFNRPVEELLAWADDTDRLTRLDLGGLAADDVERYMAERFGLGDGHGAVSRVLVHHTDGNPFYLREVIDQAVGSGDLAHDGTGWTLEHPDALPALVDRTVEARLAELDESGREVLDLLALADAAVPLRVLHHALARFTPGLAQAEHAGLVRVDVPTGRASVSHDIVRHHVVEQMSDGLRTRLHGVLGEALERHDPDRWALEIAHHFLECGHDDPDRAVRAVRRAATSAIGELSLALAADHLDAARRLARDEGLGAQTELDLAILEGDIRRRIGDRSHRDLLLHAARLAESLDDVDSLASAALAFCRIGPASSAGVVDDEALALGRRALHALDPGDSAIRARLMGAMSHLLSNAPATTASSNEGADLYDRAEEMARRLGDPAVLAEVLGYAYWAIDTFHELTRCERLAEEMIELGGSLGPSTTFAGHQLRFSSAVQRSRPEIAHDSQETMCALARRLGEPMEAGVVEYQRACLAIIAGDLDELARSSLAWVEAASRAGLADSRAISVHGSHVAIGAWLSRRMSELEAFVTPLADDLPGIPAWRLTIALIASEAGRTEEVRSIYEEVCADGFVAVPRDFIWSVSMSVAGYAVARAGLPGPSREVHECLAPYAGRISWGGSPTLGPIDQVLGETALAAGDPERARRNFADALAVAEAWDSATFRSMARVGIAEVDAGLGRVGPAADLARLALDEASPLGIELVAERARRVLEATA